MPPPTAPLPKPAPSRTVSTLLLVFAAAVGGYVLLNPPGSPEKQIKRLPAAAEAPPPAPAETQTDAPPPEALQVPAMLPLPGQRIRVGATEVTFAQFRAFVMRSGYHNPHWQNYPCESAGGRLPDWNKPGYAQRDESPVVCVSWVDADAYTRWLSAETGQRYRLPTDAEWEYAARGGTSSRYWWGAAFDTDKAACQSCPPKIPTQPAAAGAFPSNPFGLHEVLGNVREWTCSAIDSLSDGCTADARSPGISLRGGSWQQVRDDLAVDHRDIAPPVRRDVWTGFRVVQDE